MKNKTRLFQHLIVGLLLLLLVSGVVAGFIYLRVAHHSSVGVQVLRLMYCYDDVETDLVDNYRKLYQVLALEDWERLSIDNEFRAISAYYKLKGDKTDIEIVQEYKDCIIYRIINPNVSRDDLWVFHYEVKGKKVCNIREYKMARMCYSVTGVW